MKVILLRDVPNVGRKNEVKDVNDGFARNFLIARKLAALATDQKIRQIGTELAQKDERAAHEKAEYQKLADKLGGVSLTIAVKAGEKGKAFGSVSSVKILEELGKHKIEIEKDWLKLEEPIKTTGSHDIGVKFPHGVNGVVKVTIKPE